MIQEVKNSVKTIFPAHPIDPSALECCSKMMDPLEINKMIHDIDFNDLYDDNYFAQTSKQDINKGNIRKRTFSSNKIQCV